MQINLEDLSRPRTNIQSDNPVRTTMINSCHCLVLCFELPFERIWDPSPSLSDHRAKISQNKTINYREQDDRSPVVVYDPHSLSSPRELESQHQSPHLQSSPLSRFDRTHFATISHVSSDSIPYESDSKDDSYSKSQLWTPHWRDTAQAQQKSQATRPIPQHHRNHTASSCEA